jgi:hypothetical protein
MLGVYIAACVAHPFPCAIIEWVRYSPRAERTPLTGPDARERTMAPAGTFQDAGDEPHASLPVPPARALGPMAIPKPTTATTPTDLRQGCERRMNTSS